MNTEEKNGTNSVQLKKDTGVLKNNASPRLFPE